MKQIFQRSLRPDHQMYDEVVIKTVPRYKESELSGDEWRISATIEYKCKGRTMHEASYRDVETALDFVKSEFWKGADNGRVDIPYEQEFCDQEGCSKKWRHLYRMENNYCRSGHPSPATHYPFRAFCEMHMERGDCGLEDSDRNYTMVKSRD